MDRNLQALEELLEKKIKEKNLPGVSVAIYGKDVDYSKGFGIRNEKGDAIDGDTIMGIASMGKSMAALACAILHVEGKLNLDDPVSDYVKDFRVPGNPKDTVTIRHLAMHTAGIPPMEPLEWSIAVNTPGRESDWAKTLKKTAPNKMNTIEEVIDYVANCPYRTLGQSGEYFSYSNEGYAVLCYVADAASGMPLEEFLDQRVFKPLGMNRSVLDDDASEAKKIASDANITSLAEKDEDKHIWDDDWSILPPFRACATVKSTAKDMARYYRCLSNGGVLDGKKVFEPEVIEAMFGSYYPTLDKPYYCLGLQKRKRKNHTYVEHSGGLHGVSSIGGLLKDEDYGFTVLCNQGDADVYDILWALYNYVTGEDLEASHRWLVTKEKDFSDPEVLVGDYLCHEGIPTTLKVRIKDGKLKAEKDENHYDLSYCGDTWFELLNEEGQAVSRTRFFIRDDKAWGVQVYTRMFLRV